MTNRYRTQTVRRLLRPTLYIVRDVDGIEPDRIFRRFNTALEAQFALNMTDRRQPTQDAIWTTHS